MTSAASPVARSFGILLLSSAIVLAPLSVPHLGFGGMAWLTIIMMVEMTVGMMAGMMGATMAETMMATTVAVPPAGPSAAPRGAAAPGGRPTRRGGCCVVRPGLWHLARLR